ncbi:MAG TPA: tetratricopeptide repeat protein [Thermoanaerobaculia bacterium]|nr:tetratricopeptide repeat protein [Thermoanaerobaculia bacterium]
MKYRFLEFVLDREAGRLNGPDGEVRLRPQAFRMLEVLAEAAPRILSQEELLDRVWGVEHLSPASVKQAVSEVRQALGDDPARPAVIETVPRRGYRFIAPLAEEAPPAPVAPVIVAELLPAPPPPAPPPPRRRRPWRLAAAVAAPLLAGLSLYGLIDRPEPAPALLRTSLAPEAASARPSVAVLGFQNLSGNPEDDWISAALAEIVGFELAVPGDLRVIPADSVARMRRELPLAGAERPALASLSGIARNLGTDLVVTGSYLLTGAGGEETLRVQVLTQDARTGETVAWARQTGRAGAVIELATVAARGLRTTLAGSSSGSPSPEAVAVAGSAGSLRLYAQALDRLRVWDASAALPLLEQAAEVDPENPFVYDALAAAAARLGFDARAKEAAQQALTLSDALPRPIRLGMEGRSREIRGEWEEAAKAYAALWHLHPDDVETGLRLAAAQRRAGQTALAEATVAALRRLPPPSGDDPRIDLAEMDVAWQLGDFARCREVTTRAIDKAAGRGATLLAAAGHFNRAWALFRLGKAELALADFHTARDTYRKAGDRGAAAGALVGAATVLQETGRPAEARKAYEEALPVLQEIGDRSREAKALNNLAALLSEQGDYAGVITLLERSLAIKRETGDLPGTALALANLGNLLRVRGDVRGAHRRIEEALSIQRKLGDSYGIAFCLRGLSRILAKEGKPAEARAALEEALALSQKTGDAEGVAQALLALGGLAGEAGQPGRAREHYLRALAEFERLGSTADVIHTRITLAEQDFEQGRLEAARAGYEEALAAALKLGNGLYEEHARKGLAQVDEKRKERGPTLPGESPARGRG